MFKSRSCDKVFTTKRFLIHHETISTKKRFSCENCRVVFNYKFDFKCHIKNYYHKGVIKNDISTNQLTTNKSNFSI